MSDWTSKTPTGWRRGHPRPTTGSVAAEGGPLRSEAGETRRYQRRRVQMLSPDGRQQRGELVAEPGIPVQEDDLARAQRLAVPGQNTVTRHGGAPAGQGVQPAPCRRHLHLMVERPVRRAAAPAGVGPPTRAARPP